ncbi:MAG: heme NO-binding domain-containing protein [Leptonema sp. (in: bacteria)]
MHGIIFLQLYHYYNKKCKEKEINLSWIRLLQKAQIKHYTYSPNKAYPDEEIVQLLLILSQEFKMTLPEILEDFGENIVEYLLVSYDFLLKPEWKALDIIQNVAQIHSNLKNFTTTVDPPSIQTKKVDPNSVEIYYNSPRKLCFLLKGLVRGLGKYFQENLKIQESICMHKGSDHCLILVSKM